MILNTPHLERLIKERFGKLTIIKNGLNGGFAAQLELSNYNVESTGINVECAIDNLEGAITRDIAYYKQFEKPLQIKFNYSITTPLTGVRFSSSDGIDIDKFVKILGEDGQRGSIQIFQLEVINPNKNPLS